MASDEKELYARELEQWQSIFDDTKRHPLSDFLHKYYNVTMCVYSLDGKRQTSSSKSKFCHAMQNRPQTQCICQQHIKAVTSKPSDGLTTTVCPLGVVNVIMPVRYGNHNIASIVCSNMVLKDSFIPAAIREKFHLREVSPEEIHKLSEFLKILSNLVHLPDYVKNKPNPSDANHAFDGFGLTKREKEIAGLVINGYTNHKIADELYITEATVKSHVSSLLNKLDLNNRNELIERFGRS